MHELERDILNIDSNVIDIKKFEKLISNNDQGYKFYWLESLMRLIPSDKEYFTFEEIIDEMIWGAWRSVTYYHLRLGHTVNGKPVNFLEHAVLELNKCIEKDNKELLNQNLSKNKIQALIKEYDAFILVDKMQLTDYVPYRIIKPFVDKEGKAFIDKKQYGKLILYLNDEDACNQDWFYRIIDADTILHRKVILNEKWRAFMLSNYAVIMGWIQYNKAHFIQDRNPEANRVIDKVSPESEETRQSLENARNLWLYLEYITGNPLREIYSGKVIPNEKFELDHFIPWSFTSTDELWNLIPISKELNCSKNNKLPPERFIKGMIEYQYELYGAIFGSESSSPSQKMKELFKKCEKRHLNSDWALNKLYIPGLSYVSFYDILEEKIGNLYKSAKLQEYDLWSI